MITLVEEEPKPKKKSVKRKRTKKKKDAITKPTIEFTTKTTLDPLEIIQPQKSGDFDDSIDGYPIVIMTAREYANARKDVVYHLLSETPLDELVQISGEGFESGAVYLVFGANNTGKTGTCATMAVVCDGDVIWVDGGEDTIRPERFIQIATARGKDPDETIDRIHVVRAYNASHLEAILRALPKAFMQLRTVKNDDGTEIKERQFIKSRLKTEAVKLIVLDSIAPGFRNQYQGRGRLAPRQQALMRCIQYLRILSQMFNCVVLATDQIISDPGNTFTFGGPWITQKPVGGPTVTHNFDFQIRMRKSKDNIRVATVMDSSNTPLAECEFMITDRGIDTVPEPEKDEEPSGESPSDHAPSQDTSK